MTSGYWLDTLYRGTIMKPIIPKVFANGLGNPALIQHLATNFRYFRDPDYIGNYLTSKYGKHHPVHIGRRTLDKDSKCYVMEGHFQSPFNDLVPNSMPVETRTAHFTMLVPTSSSGSGSRPMVIQLAGTGDISVRLHQQYARRLLEYGVGSLLLVNPFYQPRRPAMQKSSSLLHLSDLFVMGGALILECWLLLRWLQAAGYSPLALHGVSLGGFMASLAAGVCQRPVTLIPCLSWTTASPCYTRGVLSNSMSWQVVRHQLREETAFKERIWPLIRHASCPQRCRVPPDFRDPLQPPEDAAADLAASAHKAEQLSSLESLRAAYTKLHDSLPNLGVGLFAASERVTETLRSALRQTQLLNSLETQYRRAEAASYALRAAELPPDDEEEEMRQFVACLLDYFTHLGNFEPPADTSRVFSLQALNDAYVPRDGVYPLTSLWPGMTCRTVPGGHVATILRNCYDFRVRPLGLNDFRDILLEALGAGPA